MSWTHTFHEAGNGFPQVESDVVTVDDCGDPKLVVIKAVSPIHTAQWQANMVYLECEDSSMSWDDLDEIAQNLIYESAFHVEPIAEDE